MATSYTNALVYDEESVYSAVSSYNSDPTVSFDIVADALRKESRALEELMIVCEQNWPISNIS